jgi:hypothetical protein
MTHQPMNIVDLDRSACLCDVGLPEWRAVTVVEPDGATHLMLVWDHRQGSYDPTCGAVAHEQLGPLPASWRRRVYGDPRCGALTASGRPCRHKVMEPGDHCSLHHRCELCGELDYCGTSAHRPKCPRYRAVSPPPYETDDAEAAR